MSEEKNIRRDEDEGTLVRLTVYFSKEENDWITKSAKMRRISKSYILREILWERMKDDPHE